MLLLLPLLLLPAPLFDASPRPRPRAPRMVPTPTTVCASLAPHADCRSQVVGGFGDIANDFFRMAVAGPIIGWVFGTLALFWASRVFNDALVEISISICCAYVAFYVSEFWVKSSGVLTVVFVGLGHACAMRVTWRAEM